MLPQPKVKTVEPPADAAAGSPLPVLTAAAAAAVSVAVGHGAPGKLACCLLSGISSGTSGSAPEAEYQAPTANSVLFGK